MQRKSNILTILIFCVSIAIMAIWFVVAPFREYSPRENRYLSQWPEFTTQSLLSGDWTAKVESCISDQFPLRDRWVLMNARLSYLSGRSDNNGVYYGSRLTETFWTYDSDILNKNLTAVDKFAAESAYSDSVEDNPSYQDSDSKTYFLPVPNRIFAASHSGISELPRHAPDINQDILIDTISDKLPHVETIDISTLIASEASKKGANTLYYGTDHHMTTSGAYIVYRGLCQHLDIEPLSKGDFEIKTVATDFEGTMFHKSGAWWVRPDSIEVWTKKSSTGNSSTASAITVTIGDKTFDSMYDKSALETVEKYNYFLYGNKPVEVIKNSEISTLSGTDNSGMNSDKLLVVKDSYANAILPFLANHYSEIHVIDLRYYRGSVSKYREDNGLNNTLIIYNVKNLTEDENLRMIANFFN